LAGLRHFRTGNKRARRLELAVDAFHVLLKVVRTFTVLGLFVMSAPARKVGGSRMFGSRQSAIRNAVAVNVLVTRESAQAIEVFFAQHLPARERLFRILEWVRHPVVHA